MNAIVSSTQYPYVRRTLKSVVSQTSIYKHVIGTQTDCLQYLVFLFVHFLSALSACKLVNRLRVLFGHLVWCGGEREAVKSSNNEY